MLQEYIPVRKRTLKSIFRVIFSRTKWIFDLTAHGIYRIFYKMWKQDLAVLAFTVNQAAKKVIVDKLVGLFKGFTENCQAIWI